MEKTFLGIEHGPRKHLREGSPSVKSRRDFLGMMAGSACFFSAPLRSWAATHALAPLNVRRYEVKVGLDKPFSALHVSDTHLAHCDRRENARKVELAMRRYSEMRHAEHYLDEALRYAADHDLPILHTGDLIDFTSQANYEAVSEHLAGRDVLVCAGNHEFSQYVGEAKEDAAYKAQSFAAVQKHYPNDLTFASKVISGINFLAVDDVYYDFTAMQCERLEQEIKRGLPIVILCHVPLYSPGLHARQLARRGGACADLCGTPDDKLGSNARLADRQRANATTRAFVERLRGEKLVRAILCGDLHVRETDSFSPTANTYVAGANYLGHAQVMTFV